MWKSKQWIVFLLLGIAALILGACAAQPPAPSTAEPPPASAELPEAPAGLEGTAWSLDAFGAAGAETPVVAGPEVTLEFDADGQAGGRGGCNSYGTPYQIEGNTISFGPVTSTLMACESGAVMEQEQLFFRALETASEYERTGDRLVIRYDDGRGVLQFAPRETGQAESSQTGTEPAGAEPAVSGLTESSSPPTAPAENAAPGAAAADGLCEFSEDAPGSDWGTCRSPEYGFEVDVPPGSTLLDQSPTTARIDLPFTPGTNLSEKYLEITVINAPAACLSPLGPENIPTETVQVGEMSFTRQTGQGAAAGNRYDWVAYSTSQDGLCASLGFVLHSFAAELAPTPPPLFDFDAESAVFAEIVSTFRWLEPSSEAPDESGPDAERITFGAGETSAAVSGSLPVSGSDLYVIQVMGGQTMTLDLSFSAGRAILAVWGEDGTVLMSDHAEASRFSGELPTTQDYYILLKGSPESATEYRMEVTIPPLR